MNKLDIYKMLCKLAKYAPATMSAEGIEIESKRLHTFAALFDREAMDAGGVFQKGAFHYGKDVFFSRLWDESGNDPSEIKYKYPALFCWQMSEQITQMVKKQSAESSVELVFAFADKMPYNTTGGDFSYSVNRTFEQAEEDLRTIAKTTLQNLAMFEYGTGRLGASIIFTGWYHPSEIAILKTNGVIDRWDAANKMSNNIKSQDIDIDIYYNLNSQKLMAIMAVVEFQISECVPKMEFTSTPALDPAIDMQNDGCC